MLDITFLQELLRLKSVDNNALGCYDLALARLANASYVRINFDDRSLCFIYHIYDENYSKQSLTLNVNAAARDLFGKEAIRYLVDSVGEKDALASVLAPLARASKSLPHLCFGGHVDVVPANEGRQEGISHELGGMLGEPAMAEPSGWDFPPFSAAISEDFIYGRGVLDMKGALAAFIEALDASQNEGLSGKIISLLLVSDEEMEGYCTPVMLSLLGAHGVKIDFALVGEPTSEKELGDSVKNARRGSVHVDLSVYGRGGHVAYSDGIINPIDLVANKLALLTREISYEPPFGSNHLVARYITSDVDISNQSSSTVTLRLNIRNSLSLTLEKIERFIRNTLEGIDEAEIDGRPLIIAPIKEYDLKIDATSHPFASRLDSPYSAQLESAIRSVTGLTPSYNASGGTSDARSFAHAGIYCLEFGLLNSGIHAVNERLAIKDYAGLIEIYRALILNFK